MAVKSEFDGMTTFASTSKLAAATLNAIETGIQEELEERLYAHTPAGVVSGLEGSISSTSIAVAAGDGYAGGKRYKGAGSIAFAGADAGTYYVYYDQSADALAKNTAAPDTEEDLLICQVVWSGAALSDLVDLRSWGVERLLFAPHFASGTVAAGTTQWACIVPWDAWIQYVQVALRDTGTGGAGTIVDVNVGNSGGAQTTIFTTQTCRPSCTSGVTGWTVQTSGVPDTRLVAAGQVVTIDIDSAATGAQDIVVQIYGRLR
jgi:hypothetical protein